MGALVEAIYVLGKNGYNAKGERQAMTIPRNMKINIGKAIRGTRKAGLRTTVVLEVCCYIDGLGSKLFAGGTEYRFKRYIKQYMPETFAGLKKRSKLLGQKDDFCLHALWRDIRCGLVHEIDPKATSAIIGKGRMPVHLNVNDNRYTGMDLVLSSPRFIADFLRSLRMI